MTLQEKYWNHISHTAIETNGINSETSQFYDESYPNKTPDLQLVRGTYQYLKSKTPSTSNLTQYELINQDHLTFSEMMNVVHYYYALKMRDLVEHINLNSQRIRKLDPEKDLFRIKRIKNDNYHLNLRHENLRKALGQSLKRMIAAVVYLSGIQNLSHENLNFKNQGESEKGAVFNRMVASMFQDPAEIMKDITLMYKRFGFDEISTTGVSPMYTSSTDIIAKQTILTDSRFKDASQDSKNVAFKLLKGLAIMDRRFDADWGPRVWYTDEWTSSSFPSGIDPIVHFHSKAASNIALRGYGKKNKKDVKIHNEKVI